VAGGGRRASTSGAASSCNRPCTPHPPALPSRTPALAHPPHNPPRQAHYSATLRLKRFFPFTLIDSMGSLAETQEQITKELRWGLLWRLWRLWPARGLASFERPQVGRRCTGASVSRQPASPREGCCPSAGWPAGLLACGHPLSLLLHPPHPDSPSPPPPPRRYQSSLDLGAATYSLIRHLPLARDLVFRCEGSAGAALSETWQLLCSAQAHRMSARRNQRRPPPANIANPARHIAARRPALPPRPS
jgi:hypothetical protein